MNKEYGISLQNKFLRRYRKLSKVDKQLVSRIDDALIALRKDPFKPSLRTHKVNTRNFGVRYSSRVTGDARIIWDFDANNSLNILILTIGGHSGKERVYN